MALNPVNFYIYAGEIHDQASNTEEEKIRSAISRAYYAAFLSARNYAGIKEKKPTVHQLTADHFLSAGMSAVANRLNELRTSRNQADYDCELHFVKRDSGKALTLARAVIIQLGLSLPD